MGPPNDNSPEILAHWVGENLWVTACGGGEVCWQLTIKQGAAHQVPVKKGVGPHVACCGGPGSLVDGAARRVQQCSERVGGELFALGQSHTAAMSLIRE